MKAVRVATLVLLALFALAGTGCMSQPVAQGSVGVVSDGDVLFVGSTDGRILSIDTNARAGGAGFPSAGEWEYAITKPSKGGFGCSTTQSPSIIYGNPALSDGRLCVATYDGKVLMLDAASRQAGLVFPQVRSGEWQYPRSDDSIGPIVGSPAVVGNVVYVCSSKRENGQTSGLVYALDRVYGDELWVSEPLDGKLWVTPAVDGGSLIVSTLSGLIFQLDASSGAVQPWTYDAGVGFVSSPLVLDGTVYVGSFDRSLYAIPVGAQTPSWRFEAGNWFWSTPIAVGDTLYASCLDGKLYALNAATGAQVWGAPYDAGGAIAAPPVVIGDRIVVVTKSGDVHVVSLATGLGARVPNPSNEKAPTCDAAVVAAPAAHEGVVYIRAQNNTLFGIDPIAASVVSTFSLKME